MIDALMGKLSGLFSRDDRRQQGSPAKSLNEVYAPYGKNKNEDLVSYYKRLADTREGGILGTGGMMDVPAGQVVGYDSANKPVESVVEKAMGIAKGSSSSSSGSNGYGSGSSTSNQDHYNNMRNLMDNPEAAMALRALLPFGLGHLFLSDDQIEGYVRNNQNEATKDQGFWNYLMGRDGDVVQGNIELDKGFLGLGADDPSKPPKGYKYDAKIDRFVPISGSGSLVTGSESARTPWNPNKDKFDVGMFTKDADVIAAHNKPETTWKDVGLTGTNAKYISTWAGNGNLTNEGATALAQYMKANPKANIYTAFKAVQKGKGSVDSLTNKIKTSVSGGGSSSSGNPLTGHRDRSGLSGTTPDTRSGGISNSYVSTGL